MTFNRTVQQLSELIEVKKERAGKYRVRRSSDNAEFVITNRSWIGLPATEGWFIRCPISGSVFSWEFSASRALRKIASGFNQALSEEL